MFGLGLPELIVIFLVIIILFGAKSIPDIAKALGQGIRLFKKEASSLHDDINSVEDKSKDETSSKA